VPRAGSLRGRHDRNDFCGELKAVALTSTLRTAGARFWLTAVGWAAAIGIATGVPTVMVETSLFRRMTPILPWQYALWGFSSLLVGLVLAARKLPGQACRVEGRALSGTTLSYLAIGCPICNKIVVVLLGVSGALHYFAPLQPLIGIGALVILLFTLHRLLEGRRPPTARHSEYALETARSDDLAPEGKA
jgi:hypothetical protein